MISEADHRTDIDATAALNGLGVSLWRGPCGVHQRERVDRLGELERQLQRDGGAR